MKKFKKVYIEITNICNLQCSFCPPTQRAGNFMQKEKFDYILEAIKEYTDYIYLHVKGEPMLHSEFSAIVESAIKKGFYVNITTNGTFIKKYGEFLITSGVRQINISCHSHTVEEEAGDTMEYMQEITEFAWKARENGTPYVSLRLWNLDEGEDKKGKNREILKIIENKFNIDKILPEKTEGRGVKIAKNVFVNFENRFTWPDEDGETVSETGYCLGLIDQTAILVDGTVVPCCLDGEGKINLGNIFEKGFGEIIESQRADAMIEGFRKRVAVEELCKSCSFKNRF